MKNASFALAKLSTVFNISVQWAFQRLIILVVVVVAHEQARAADSAASFRQTASSELGIAGKSDLTGQILKALLPDKASDQFILLAGTAGSGKTFILNPILRRISKFLPVFVTTPTGDTYTRNGSLEYLESDDPFENERLWREFFEKTVVPFDRNQFHNPTGLPSLVLVVRDWDLRSLSLAERLRVALKSGKLPGGAVVGPIVILIEDSFRSVGRGYVPARELVLRVMNPGLVRFNKVFDLSANDTAKTCEWVFGS